MHLGKLLPGRTALLALACSSPPEAPEAADHGTGTAEKLNDALVPQDHYIEYIEKLACEHGNRRVRGWLTASGRRWSPASRANA